MQHAIYQCESECYERIDRAGQQSVQNGAQEDGGRQHDIRRMASWNIRRESRARALQPPARQLQGSCLHREDRLAVGELRWQDHLDVVALHLRIARRRPLVLTVDELCRPIWHDVPAPGGARDRLGQLGPIGRARTFEGVRDQSDAAVVHVDFVRVELTLRLDAFLQFLRLGVQWIEPVIAVHYPVGGFGEFLHELVGRRRATQDGIDALRAHLLLLHGTSEKYILVVVIRGDDEVRVVRLDLEHDIVEVARWRRMRNGLEYLESPCRKLRV